MTRDLISDPTSPAYGPYARGELTIAVVRQNARYLGLELVTKEFIDDLLRQNRLKTDTLNDLAQENAALRRLLYRRSFVYRWFGR